MLDRLLVSRLDQPSQHLTRQRKGLQVSRIALSLDLGLAGLNIRTLRRLCNVFHKLSINDLNQVPGAHELGLRRSLCITGVRVHSCNVFQSIARLSLTINWIWIISDRMAKRLSACGTRSTAAMHWVADLQAKKYEWWASMNSRSITLSVVRLSLVVIAEMLWL